MRAIVIDDSLAMRAVVARALRLRGFEVFEADNGQTGLLRLREVGRPDVIFVDWNMPVMDGLKFVSAVRSDPRLRDVPVVMVTSETETAQVQRALGVGVNEYIMKPFTQQALYDKLRLLGLEKA